MVGRSALLTAVIVSSAAALGMSLGSCNGFMAHLSGSDEVPAVQSAAQGQALFVFTAPPMDAAAAATVAAAPGVPPAGPKAGPAVPQLRYKLLISKTAPADGGDPGELLAAEIHCAAVGESGPVAVTLFEAVGGGVATPTSVQGTLTEDSIPQPNDCGYATLEDLVAAMQSGDTYVNVSTNAYPDGEIRGQVQGVGPQ
jgi:hypothetical protein